MLMSMFNTLDKRLANTLQCPEGQSKELRHVGDLGKCVGGGGRETQKKKYKKKEEEKKKPLLFQLWRHDSALGLDLRDEGPPLG